MRYFISGGVTHIARHIRTRIRGTTIVEPIAEGWDSRGKYLDELIQLDQKISGETIAVKASNFGFDERVVDDLLPLIDESDNRWMLDAEEIDHRPAVDKIAERLITEIAVEKPRVFKTYQSYDVDGYDLLNHDLAVFNGFPFGAKLVRGAYYRYESRIRREQVFDEKYRTDEAYRRMMNRLLREVVDRDGELAAVFATHNREDNEYLVQRVTARPELRDHIATAQLMNMAPSLHCELRMSKLPTQLFIPYGHVTEAIPYLLRRLWENLDAIVHMSR